MKKRKNPEEKKTFIDSAPAASTTDCTGIVSSAPKTHEGLEEIMNTMKFSPTDVPMKKKDV